jgi:hypothetical protein
MNETGIIIRSPFGWAVMEVTAEEKNGDIQ